jgi:transposase
MTTLPTDIKGLQDLILLLLSDLQTVKGELSLVKSANAALQSENADLKSQLGLSSRNSHKPPTSDGLNKPPTMPRGKGGQVGGQRGHKGSHLKMVQSAEQIDTVVPYYPLSCGLCGQTLATAACELSARRQVFDLPQPKLSITEHQVFGCRCGKCGYRTLATFPQGVNAPVQYGSGAKAFATLLNQHYLLPFAKVSDLFDTLFGQPFNVSTLQSSNVAIYEALETTESAIQAAIVASPVAHFDETGLHINGTLNWLHVAATEQQTYYFAHAKRGTPALIDTPSVLRLFKGIAVHDCWSSYFKFDKCQHALCNAHLLRELQAAFERGYTWAKSLQDQFKELLQLKQTDQLTPKIGKEKREKLKDQLLIIQKDLVSSEELSDNKSKILQKTKALIDRLNKHLDKFLAFALNPDVPFTNNLAERDIRMVKLKAKISGGFRTEKGAYVFARIKGVIATARKQNKNVLQVLTNAYKYQDGKIDYLVKGS